MSLRDGHAEHDGAAATRSQGAVEGPANRARGARRLSCDDEPGEIRRERAVGGVEERGVGWSGIVENDVRQVLAARVGVGDGMGD